MVIDCKIPGFSSSDEKMVEEGRKHGEPRIPVESLTESGDWEIEEGYITRL